MGSEPEGAFTEIANKAFQHLEEQGDIGGETGRRAVILIMQETEVENRPDLAEVSGGFGLYGYPEEALPGIPIEDLIYVCRRLANAYGGDIEVTGV